MDVIFINLMVVFAVAVSSGIIFRFLGLPSLIGQVAAGFLIGLSGFIGAGDLNTLHLLGSLGVTLLLFLVGLEMNLKEVKNTGKVFLKVFLIQTILMSIIFWFSANVLFGLSGAAAILVALSLCFSSTIVVVKMLSERKDLNSYAGKLTLGILLLQDLISIVVLVLLPSLSSNFNFLGLGELFGKMVLLILVINIIGHFVISFIEKNLIKTNEDLVLFSLVWFGLALYFSVNVLHLTSEIGGLLAGLSLSTSYGHFQIASKVKTLRDIFLTVFFVLLGLQIGTGKINWLLVGEIVILSIFVKFIFTELSCYLGKIRGKVAFSLSINVTQLSEFSLIVMSFGLASGLWGSELVSAFTVAGLISMVVSTVLINRSSLLYKFAVNKMPGIFKAGIGERVQSEFLKHHVVLLGGDRTGRSILTSLSKNGEKVLVVDFNQEIVERLKKKGKEAIFADASDPDVIEAANMKDAKMIISTVKDIDDSLALLSELKNKEIKVPTIVDAESAYQAAELYKAGASYVIFPHFVSGLHLGQLMKRFEKDTTTLKKYRDRQNETLKDIYEGEF